MRQRWLAASRASGRRSTGASWYVISLMTPWCLNSIPQMTSIRHGLRVMHYADISQHDWSADKILCNLPPSSQAHAVLTNFSATTQTLDLDVDPSSGMIMGNACLLLRITILVWIWIGYGGYWDRDEMKRESWDTNEMGVMSQGALWPSNAVDRYKFVYDGLALKIQTVCYISYLLLIFCLLHDFCLIWLGWIWIN